MKKRFLDLGRQPISNAFLTQEQFDDEYFYHLQVAVDSDTFLVSQYQFNVEKSKMFNEHYVYHSSGSQTMRSHFANAASIFRNMDKILEVGSNDGVFLRYFNLDNVVAVEPCGNFAKMTNDMGYKTYCEFWNQDTAQMILKSHGEQNVVFAANCVCHIPEIDEVIKSVATVLSDDGIFVFEDPSCEMMLDRVSYDQIYDEHAHIFSVMALNNQLKLNGMKLFRVEELPVHGGSNRIYACLDNRPIEDSVYQHIERETNKRLDDINTYIEFGNKVHNSKMELLSLLEDLYKQNKKVISYGATSKSTTIFNYCHIGPDLIEYITDTTPSKQGKYSPGTHIPVVSYKDNFGDDIDYAFLGAWNYLQEITTKEQDYLNRGGRFITHVPEIRII